MATMDSGPPRATPAAHPEQHLAVACNLVRINCNCVSYPVAAGVAVKEGSNAAVGSGGGY